MAKEEQLVFFRTLTVILVILILNIVIFSLKYGNFNRGLTGFSIKTTVYEMYSTMPRTSKIFLLSQWGLLLLLLIYVAIKDKAILGRQKEVKGLDLKKFREKAKTDLDALYALLKDKKKIRVAIIAKAFDIDKSLAMDWCKILESGKLATIDYPGIGGPVVRLRQREIIKVESIKPKVENKKTIKPIENKKKHGTE